MFSINKPIVVMFLCCVLLNFFSNDATANSKKSSRYWNVTGSGGFAPSRKANASCIDPSIKRLCIALDEDKNEQQIANSAKGIDVKKIIQAGNEVLNDAHHQLAIAACKIGNGQNPEAKKKQPPITLPFDIGKPLLELSAALVVK